MSDIKQEVRQFYDQIGWQTVSGDMYQNARFEDLRPVSREYIHRCHLRVGRHIQRGGRFLLDAGSGPVQYPEYLEYARGFEYRVCADISITALREARKRIGERGLFVVADVANLPFASETFDGEVSLHTIHHLPEDEQLRAFQELYRLLKPGGTGVVVNGWAESRLLKFFEPLIRLANRLRHAFWKMRFHTRSTESGSEHFSGKRNRLNHEIPLDEEAPKSTFTKRHDVAWVKNVVGVHIPVEILVWRSVSVRFMRALIHPKLGGQLWLRLLFGLEERFPRFFGENGKYPLLVIRKE